MKPQNITKVIDNCIDKSLLETFTYLDDEFDLAITVGILLRCQKTLKDNSQHYDQTDIDSIIESYIPSSELSSILEYIKINH